MIDTDALSQFPVLIFKIWDGFAMKKMTRKVLYVLLTVSVLLGFVLSIPAPVNAASPASPVNIKERVPFFRSRAMEASLGLP